MLQKLFKLVLYTGVAFAAAALLSSLPTWFMTAEGGVSEEETSAFVHLSAFRAQYTTSRFSQVPETPAAQVTTTTRVATPMVSSQQNVDKRVPRFVQTEAPDNKTVKIQWTSPNDGRLWSQTIYIDRHAYEYYRALPRYETFADYQNYLDDGYNRRILSSLAESFRSFERNREYTGAQIMQEAIAFVQAIPYQYDILSTGSEEFQKYPLETLYDFGGDCEDLSFLLAGILRELGYEVCLLRLPGHCAVGIQNNGSFSGRYFEYQGKQYFYVESTNTGWRIGDMPEEYTEDLAELLVID